MCRSKDNGDRRCDSGAAGNARRRVRYAEQQAEQACRDGDSEAHVKYAQSAHKQRQSLLAEHEIDCEPRPLPEDLWVDSARMIATDAHKGQWRRDGTEYITHPARVAQRLQDAQMPAHVVAAGWMHDTVEDTSVTLDFLRSAGHPDKTVNTVDNVTHRDDDSSYEGRTMDRATQSFDSTVLKDADNADNTSDRLGPTPDQYVKQMRRNEKYLAGRRKIKARLYDTPDGQREAARIFDSTPIQRASM